jgi:malonyl-CoA O-methyltransferase
MVAGFKSERWPASNRYPWPASVGIRSKVRFNEWRRAHADLGMACGTQIYPSDEAFPWPAEYSHAVSEELVAQTHANGADFVRSLKALGAREPTPGYRPLPPGAFRRLLTALEGSFSVTYHVLYAEIFW